MPFPQVVSYISRVSCNFMFMVLKLSTEGRQNLACGLKS